jgi:hypothetical protein
MSLLDLLRRKANKTRASESLGKVRVTYDSERRRTAESMGNTIRELFEREFLEEGLEVLACCSKYPLCTFPSLNVKQKRSSVTYIDAHFSAQLGVITIDSHNRDYDRRAIDFANRYKQELKKRVGCSICVDIKD